MAGAFASSAFQNSAFQTDGAAVATPAAGKHRKRENWRVRTPEGTFDFDSAARAQAFVANERRRLAAERRELADQGVFTPKAKLQVVRTDLEPEVAIAPTALRLESLPEFVAPQMDRALVLELLARQDDEAAMALILEHL